MEYCSKCKKEINLKVNGHTQFLICDDCANQMNKPEKMPHIKCLNKKLCPEKYLQGIDGINVCGLNKFCKYQDYKDYEAYHQAYLDKISEEEKK